MSAQLPVSAPHDLFTPALEATSAMPAVTPSPTPRATRTPPLVPGGIPADVDRWAPKIVVPAPAVPEPLAATPAVPAPLAPEPGPAPVAPEPEPEPAGHLDDPIADAFHLIDCACPNPQDYPGHVEQYAPLAAMTRKTVLAELPPAVPTPAPVETKVIAATWGTFSASLALALVTLLLGQIDVLPSLLGGANPWAGPVMLVLSVVLPTAAAFLRGYLAAHSPRTATGAVAAPAGP